jgi:hypothetical protein
MKKSRGRKSRDRVPLIGTYFAYILIILLFKYEAVFKNFHVAIQYLQCSKHECNSKNWLFTLLNLNFENAAIPVFGVLHFQTIPSIFFFGHGKSKCSKRKHPA